MKSLQTVILGLVLLAGGMTLCGFELWQLLKPAQYQASVRIEIESFGTDISSLGTCRSFDPYFVQTTFEIIKSELILENVITNLNLNEIWGKKYNDGNLFETAQTLKRLQPQLQFESFPDARVIKISFTDDGPDEAANIANAIAAAYIKYRISLIVGSTGIELETLQRQYDLEEKRIKIMQANVAEMRRHLSISDDPVNSELDHEQLHQLFQQLLEAMRDYKNSTNQLNELRSYNKQKMDDPLLLEFPDSALTNLFTNLKLVKEKLTALTNTESLTNVEVLHAQSELDALNQQIESRVVDDINTLTNKLAFQKNALDSVRDMINEAKQAYNGAKMPPSLQIYYDARLKLDQMLEQHRLLSLKIAAAKVDAMLPKSSMVQIIDFAVPPKDPLPRNYPLAISLFGIGLFPSVAGWLLLKSSRQSTV